MHSGEKERCKSDGAGHKNNKNLGTRRVWGSSDYTSGPLGTGSSPLTWMLSFIILGFLLFSSFRRKFMATEDWVMRVLKLTVYLNLIEPQFYIKWYRHWEGEKERELELRMSHVHFCIHCCLKIPWGITQAKWVQLWGLFLPAKGSNRNDLARFLKYSKLISLEEQSGLTWTLQSNTRENEMLKVWSHAYGMLAGGPLRR